ncbi:22370_t:CDS:2 [Racocetra persica]|uniref:22370_t:CDS:1 n=1 Tax=Racocetra persica TaxID=160502 RepID=A0ACA9KEP1_9GLOM|nr:22370_t:CDS:2 [Racocetra persica]
MASFVQKRNPKKTTTRSVTRAAKEKAAAEAATKAEVSPQYDGDIFMKTESTGTFQTEMSEQIVEEDAASEVSTIATPIDTPTGPPSPSNNFPMPLNLNSVHKPFKNPHYKTAKKFKNVKQMLAAERNNKVPLDIPTYSNIEAPPSIIPQKKYCDITGLEGKYTDPKTRLRYHSAEVYKEIKQLAPGVVQDYLGLRHAAVVLR